MKFVFLVQGEGRGHLTQAISLSKILRADGHEISDMIVGKSKRRKLPAFFLDQIDAPIVQIESPNFITDKKSKSVKIVRSVLLSVWRIRTFLQSIRVMHEVLEESKPDVMINFYDFLGGLYFMLKKTKVKHIAIAHQFLAGHPDFEFPNGRLLDKRSLKLGNALAGYGASRILALSFQPFEPMVHGRLHVVPPLLRAEVKSKPVTAGDHFLVYMVNHGYAEQVREFHREHPEIPLHCFWDNSEAPTTVVENRTLTFHQLDDQKFLDYMASCRGYLSTAGFESICEAMYMGKPTLMVPVQGHYEQACNALDATKAGAGISNNIFELNSLLEFLPKYQPVTGAFHPWADRTEKLILQNLIEDVN